MTRASRMMLFSMACLVFSTASASAECAWVLWKQPTALKGGDGQWEVWAAYPNITACTRALDSRETDARKGIPFTEISKRAPTELFLTFRKDLNSIGDTGVTWQCLPDTIDPRGPKGR